MSPITSKLRNVLHGILDATNPFVDGTDDELYALQGMLVVTLASFERGLIEPLLEHNVRFARSYGLSAQGEDGPNPARQHSEKN